MNGRIRVFFLLAFLVAILSSVNVYGRANADYNESGTKVVAFHASLETALARRNLKPAEFCDPRDLVSRRILKDYGAVFLATDSVLSPPVCIFSDAKAVDDFQKQMRIASAEIGASKIELQSAAMKALLAAQKEAVADGSNITPRDGAEAARRDYEDSIRLWNSRFFPALDYWQKRGKLSISEVQRVSLLPVRDQIGAVLQLEDRGIFFSRDFSKSILYSVAAPGASQHLSLLAFDVNEHSDEKVRRILARHGWFRTVKNDAPHFTFLGLEEKDLPSRGLRKLITPAGEFWIPNLENY
jgi:hypothetical protein